MNYTPEQLQAIQEVLQSLLFYEGGEMQSMNEQISTSLHNSFVLQKASELKIDLDTSKIGRSDWTKKNTGH